MNNESTKKIISTAAGVLLGGALLLGAYFEVSTVIADHAAINQIVTYLNNSAKAVAQPATVAPSAINPPTQK